jgi:hypothetical protein
MTNPAPLHLLVDLDGETVARLYCEDSDSLPQLTLLHPQQGCLVLTGDALYALHGLLVHLPLRLPL